MARLRDVLTGRTHVPGQHRPRPIRNGLIFFALLMFVLYIGYTRDIPLFNEGHKKISAHVTDSANVFTGNIVRVNGVEVGKVTAVKRDNGGEGARIDMDIMDDDVTIREDARAAVYWRTLLGGNYYVELDPGSPSAPEMEDEGVIPLERTSSQVEFDELLTTFDHSGRAAIQTFFKEFQKGFEDGGARRTIERLGPAMRGIGPAVEAVRGQERGRDIPELLRHANRTFGALARDEDQLAGLIEGANTTLAVTAARRQDIGTMLDQAPATFDETRATLDRLRTTLDELDPVAKDLGPGVRRLDETVARTRPAMRALETLLPEAEPVLQRLAPATRGLRAASRLGLPVMKGLAPTLDRVSKEINPFLEKRDEVTNLKNAWTVGPFFSGIGGSSANFDANGYAQNFDTLNGLGDVIASSFDCSLLPATAAAGCKALLSVLGQALFAGPTAQENNRSANP